MKYFIIFCFAFLFLSSCGKKEEVIIKKQSEPVSTTVPTGKGYSDSSEKIPGENNSNSAAGNVSITSSEAASYVNKTAAVTGFIADVVIREKVSYLNFDKRYPKNTFTAVIFSDKYKEFGDLTRFKNKTVEVKGKINTYNGKPQIIMNSISQIKVKGI